MTSKFSGLGMALQEPLFEPNLSEDTEDSSTYSLTTVSENDNVYKEVCIDFDNADLTVLKIERLTNSHLWKRYETERNLMIKQRRNLDPDFTLNEKYLYHGTSALKSFICEEGLDSRMSKEGCFGKGVYFSDFPRKCVKYAERGENSESFILLVRVIRGTPKIYPKGEKDRKLVREPEKTPPYKGYRFYDSVEGCPVNHKEFVVYESRRALVECIITFSKKSTPKAVSDSLQPSVVARNEAFSDIDSDFSDSDTDAPTERRRVDEYADDRSQSSDDDSDEDIAGANDSSAEVLLKQKQAEFRKKTGVMDDYIVDQYLLRGNLSVSEAVRLFREKPKDGELAYREEIPGRSELELELEQANKRPEHPAPGSSEWQRLSEEDKEEVIKSLVDDFLSVTGMTEKDYARTRLSSVNYSLDHAVLAHYEEISSEFGIV
ncbi:unnamed protein product [Candidula unifasciata]|uniref:Poly [ADP-ribose] polymerase n=1 Tax=Candidula unifasciata TaxID=100452 RepID=A0A8S4A0Y3_9EUPU|nr:unnamed protein product [Candidula unifasciata]